VSAALLFQHPHPNVERVHPAAMILLAEALMVWPGIGLKVATGTRPGPQSI
jgi:hypothetical protein